MNPADLVRRLWRPLPGRFEGLQRGWLIGWAWNPAQPLARVTVELLGDDGTRRTALADRHRADVEIAGFGDGCYGFAAPAAPFRDARRIECIFSHSGFTLAGSPLVRGRSGAAVPVRRGSLAFAFDASRCGDPAVSGYAVDLAQPHRRLRMTLADNRIPLESTRACLYRPEARAHGGDGFNGFRFECAPLRRSGLTIDVADADCKPLVLDRLWR
jgi:hypothetical protein